MTLVALPPDLDPTSARPYLADLGFLASSDLPDRPGPAYLLVALRRMPTFHHYDPERIEYWVTSGDRGSRREIRRESRFPIKTSFSWGLIRIVDRLGISNEYLTFGGNLVADAVDDIDVAVFTSPAPLLRRGGHSQGWDDGAEAVGAFFGRVMLAVDYVPGFEGTLGRSSPLTRYALFVADTIERYRRSVVLRTDHPDLWITVESEGRRMRAQHPSEWTGGVALLRAMAPGTRAA